MLRCGLVASLWGLAEAATIACFSTPLEGPLTKCVTAGGVLSSNVHNCCFKINGVNGSVHRGCTAIGFEREELCTGIGTEKCGPLTMSLEGQPIGSIACACTSDFCNGGPSLIPILPLYLLLIVACSHSFIR